MSEGWKARLQGLEVYLDRRVVAVLFLGFSSGLPILLILKTLSAWLADIGVDKSTIGLFGFVLAPYTIKFLWAPFMDRMPLPPLTAMFGRRRGWLLATQACLMVAIFGLGLTDPSIDLFMTALLAFMVAFFSASQDIVIDAYRIELLSEDQQGAGAANIVTGYRLGMWVAGAGALYVADAAGWSAAYTVMALLVLIGVVTVLLLPEPEIDAPVPLMRSAAAAGPGRHRFLILAAGLGVLLGIILWDGYGLRAGIVGGLLTAALFAALAMIFDRSSAFREGAIEPFQDFFQRNGLTIALVILAFISLFKASDVLLTLMANPFYLETGFTKSQIAWVSGTFGFFVTFVGAYVAGLLIYRIGIMPGLWISGILMMASNLMFALQAHVGADYALFHLTILIENLSGGMGTTAFVAYLASLCNRRYTAVQYALLTSFMQMLGKYLIVPGSGFLAESMGWINFFVLSAFAGIPALVLLWWLGRRVSITAPEPAVAV
ncbi:MAG: AmpG family muropeptide MFS transporter [Rhizobiales bacterium]|nr:AmpG family muropeptide MFS transporter [Hyphomicrobiales bacterium]